MATELRWALIVISALVIGGLLIHGLWSVRKKEQPQEQQREKEPEPVQTDSLRNNDEPDMGEMNFAAVDEGTVINSSEEDTNEHSQNVSTDSETETPTTGAAEHSSQEPSDFIILHIAMPEGLTMAGSRLLPTVLSLGFKYSDEGFFNRHVEPSGNGPVLFRLVNMFNPGTFDIDNMEQFGTAGVSLFMTLPCEGDSLAAFNMLHGAAKKLADEFGATVLDSNREPLSVNAVRAYVEKVREYAA
ncbi:MULTISPECIES: cell division protein ZipA [unclassified Pseudoalteromonas]|uniref:cell division protein ZipA n=1 Tax=unclassified Pseudoalteromonas TaxID=194690 RepID=UPI001B3A1ED9|nr:MULTISPECIES: cell division protein ZipA [unclassified Pseudoalteromonas]MBQ4847549.1 cell division protein ZipA [Pseudoalteromonas sp. MMG005]MBQ4851508.1 cell division protein ZipA [Pseudoalteromonas sp. MMG012]